MSIVRFMGRVHDRKTALPQADLVVEAWSLRTPGERPVGAARTNEDGAFVLSFETRHLDELFGNAGRVLFFRVKAGSKVLASTERTLRWDARASATGQIAIAADRMLFDDPSGSAVSYTVDGTVTRIGTALVTGNVVKVFHRVLTAAGVTEALVGTFVVPPGGSTASPPPPPPKVAPFTVTFSLPAAGLGAALRVEASDGGGIFAEAMIARADVRTSVSLTEGGATPAATKFVRLRAATDPLRPKTGDLAWTEEQVSLAAGMARLDRAEMRALADAELLSRATPSVSSEIYFGLLSERLPATPVALFNRGRSDMQRALEAAMASNTITPGLDLEGTLDALEAVAADELMSTTDPDVTPIGAVVSLTAGETLAESTRKQLARLYVRHDGVADAIWAAAATDPMMGTDPSTRAANVAELRTRVDIGYFASDHRPVIHALRTAPGVAAAGDVANLTRTEIRTLLDGITPAYPPSTPGDTDAERKDAYAKTIADRIERRHRTAFHKKVFASGTHARTFLDANPGLELGKHRLARYLKENPNALDGVPELEKAAVVTTMKEEQRLFRLTSYSHEVSALRAAGYASAFSIMRKGRARFLASMAGSGLSAEDLEGIVHRAAHAHAASQSAQGKYSSAAGHAGVAALPSSKLSVAQSKTADWDILFGSADACRCEHCLSVLGPAAYLVDLLQFLHRMDGPGGGDAHAAFLTRRPDVERLRLDCETATTPLPLVDVVNEIMEVRLAMAVAVPAGAWPTHEVRTSGTAEDLLALPEPVYDRDDGVPLPLPRTAAYAHLATRVHPFDAPYDLWADEASAYLDHLGVPRHELATILAPAATPPGELPAPELRAMLQLELTRKGWEIVAGPESAAPHELWGLPASPDYVSALAEVRLFLRKSGLSFDELNELLATAWADGVTLAGETCDIDAMSIVWTDPKLRFLNRLLRLRRKTGLAFPVLDRARAAFLGTISGTTVSAFATAVALARRHVEPLSTSFTWWAEIDTHSTKNTPSTFHELFLDRSVQNPDDEAFETLVDQPSGDGTTTLGDVIAGLTAGLRLGEAELRVLLPANEAVVVAELRVPSLLRESDALTLSNVSELVRHASLARALRMGMADLVLLKALSGESPLARDPGHAGPKDTEAFFDLADRLRASPLRLAHLDYLLRDWGRASLRPDVEPWLDELEAGMARIATDAAALVDRQGERAAALLTELFAAPLDADLLQAIRAEPPGTAPDGTTHAQLVRQHLGPFVEDADALVDALFGTTLSPVQARLPLGERYTYVAQRLERHVLAKAFALGWISQTLAVEPDVAKFLLEKRLHWPGEAKVAMWAFVPGADPSLPAANRTILETILRRLHKAALVVRELQLTRPQVEFVLRSEVLGTLPLLDLDALPTTPVEAAQPMPVDEFASMMAIVDIVAMSRRFPGGPTSFQVLLRSFIVGREDAPPPDRDTALGWLAEAAGWSLADLTLLADRFGYAQVTALTDTAALLRLERAVLALGRLGASAAEGVAWVTLKSPADTSMERRTARDIVRATRAKFLAPEGWLPSARAVRDRIRARQRKALVNALLDELALEKPDELYATLLLDVEVSPAPLTSRIVQATASVQLFVQRALLHLEPGIYVDEVTAALWTWMKSYRVWEANRKVFLHPENYLLPELRDDKTPLFQELETYLLQGEMTHERAEEAYRRYLGGLEELANLRPVAVCKGTDGGVHLLARTEAPHRYFYRERRGQRWDPWQRVDLDVEGDHFALVAVGSRVCLLWLTIEEIRSRYQQPGFSAPPLLENRIALHFSELRDGAWTKRVSSERWSIGVRNFKRYWKLTTAVENGVLLAEASVAVWPAMVYYASAAWNVDLARGTIALTGRLALAPDDITATYRDDEGSDRVLIDHPPFAVDHDVVQVDIYRTALLPEGQADMPGINGDGEWPRRVSVWLGDGLARVFRYLPWPANFRLLIEPLLLRQERPQRLFTVTDLSRSLLVEIPPTFGHFEAFEEDDDKSFARMNDPANYMATAARTGRTTLLTHPYAGQFRDALSQGGLDGLLAWNAHNPRLQTSRVDIHGWYDPNPAVFDLDKYPFPPEDVDFRAYSPFGVYNWELFFHIPILVATRLSRARRYEEALRWFHYVFEPTDGSGDSAPRKYWKVKPFYELRDLDDIAEELEDLAEGVHGTSGPLLEMQVLGGDDVDGSVELGEQITEWMLDPFDPHAIARMRHLAYMKWVVMLYVQNLLDWGDQLFAQDSLESVQEATQLYIHAANLLGTRPVFVDPPNTPARKTYAELAPDLDAFSNALVEAESLGLQMVSNKFPTMSSMKPKLVTGGGAKTASGGLSMKPVNDALVFAPLPDSIWTTLYFCVPPNEKLLGLWDLVEDRLFKIRHGLSIEGVARTLPLFAPPIDPALLVAATAAGLDIGSILSDLQSPAPHYRFQVLLAKANEHAQSVIALGQSLLAAMEKRDGEALALLRQTHEIALQQSMRSTRREQLREAEAGLAALEASKAPVQARYEFYKTAVSVSPAENRALAMTRDGQRNINQASELRWQAKGAFAFPDLVAGTAGMGSANWGEYGGTLGGLAIDMAASRFEMMGTEKVSEGQNLATLAGYERRAQDWKREETALAAELAALDKQILAAEIRVAVAQRELDVVETQIAQAREVDDLLKRKFTNERLYEWMVTQLAAVYFQSYQLAVDMAKRAERAFQTERGDPSQTFIGFGHWQGIRQGLLAGERLALDLRRLDAAFVAQNRREYELTKNVSLLRHAPLEVLRLREGQAATFSISEKDYDRDHPTHYLRRLRQVSVSLPCVTGPVDGVAGRLTLFHAASRVRANDLEPTTSPGVVLQSIVTSSGQNDGGLFEVNLHDERLLPFEGAGAHSEAPGQWKFELSPGADFPRRSIDDLVLHVRYTAREGRAPAGGIHDSMRWTVVRLQVDAAEAWSAFQNAVVDEIAIVLDAGRFPRPPGAATWTIQTVHLAVTTNVPPTVTRDGVAVVWAAGATIGALHLHSAAVSLGLTNPTEEWRLTFGASDLATAREQLKEAWLLLGYRGAP